MIVPGIAQKGKLLLVTSADPAANTEFSQTVTAEKFWNVISVTVSCAQGATQTPQPTLIFDDGTNVLFQGFGASSAQNSSVTTQYTWGHGNTLTAAGAATVATAPLPDVLLGPGYRVRSSTIGIGANTNFGPARILVIEYDGVP